MPSPATQSKEHWIRALRAQLPYLPQALRLVWDAARLWTMAWATLLLLQGVLPVASVFLTRAVVDSLVAALDTAPTWEGIRPTLWLVALMALVLLLLEAMRSLTTWVRTAQAELVQDHISDLIQAQAVHLDLTFYETPAYYDQLHRAQVDARHQPVALLDNLGALLQHTITLAAMVAVLIPYALWLPLLLLCTTLPALGVVVRSILRFHRWRLRNTMAMRRTRYYEWLLTLREAAAEVRLFALGEPLRRAFQQERGRLRQERVALARDQACAEMAAGSLGLLSTAGAVAWMVWQAVQGLVTLGDVALFYQAFSQGQRMMRTLLNSVGEMMRHILFVENLFEFLALRPQLLDPAHPTPAPPLVPADMRLEHVTFRYPGSPRLALADFSLTLPAGKIVALVGENGAGKSTIIKLLCRFYDPEAGRVLLGDVDVRELSLTWLRRQITVLFQEPVHFHTTAARNIALGDLTLDPDLDAVIAAARAAGADTPIRRLSQGYETVLGKWFGGVELSVGEWQRVALARAFLQQSPIIILDEPTSAMDSWAEADWLARFRTLVAKRTALVITHRLTTAMQADIIQVMMQGRIVESGTHAELLALQGRYAQSWHTQMHDARSAYAPFLP